VQTIAAGESFDGGMFVYDRGQDCTGQSEGGDSDAVFILEVSNFRFEAFLLQPHLQQSIQRNKS
jgi:hypothetical protein